MDRTCCSQPPPSWAGLISADKAGDSDEVIKTAFIRVYRQMEEAKRELSPRPLSGSSPLRT